VNVSAEGRRIKALRDHPSCSRSRRSALRRCHLLTPQSASCSSGQRFVSSLLRTPSHPGRPCRAASTSPCRVCRGLSPPRECALPGAREKKKAVSGALIKGHSDLRASRTLSQNKDAHDATPGHWYTGTAAPGPVATGSVTSRARQRTIRTTYCSADHWPRHGSARTRNPRL
jgi:hypothetical protein